MKRKIFTTIIIAALLFTMSVPTFAKSSKFGFTLSNRVVDGSENGKYHSLDGGTYASISGSMVQTGGATETDLKNTIYAELRNKTSGNSFGVVTLGKPSGGIMRTTFSGTFDERKTGGGTKYYLIIYRGESDGRTMSGEGTLKD